MDRPDGIAAHLQTLGWDCSDLDIVNADLPGQSRALHDLSSDHLWTTIHKDLREGEYAAVFIGTPCETRSRARTGPPGPRPLCSQEHLYGLPRRQLSDREFEQVRLGTYFALKTIETATIACDLRIPGFIENPDPAGNPVSLFNLPEWVTFAARPEVRTLDFHQCPMGAETAKPTRVIYWGMDLQALQGRCNHPKQWWRFRDHQGRQRTVFASHPPLAGRIREDGSMATKAAAAYPSEMNRRIAEAAAATARVTAPSPPQP